MKTRGVQTTNTVYESSTLDVSASRSVCIKRLYRLPPTISKGSSLWHEPSLTKRLCPTKNSSLLHSPTLHCYLLYHRRALASSLQLRLVARLAVHWRKYVDRSLRLRGHIITCPANSVGMESYAKPLMRYATSEQTLASTTLDQRRILEPVGRCQCTLDMRPDHFLMYQFFPRAPSKWHSSRRTSIGTLTLPLSDGTHSQRLFGCKRCCCIGIRM